MRRAFPEAAAESRRNRRRCQAKSQYRAAENCGSEKRRIAKLARRWPARSQESGESGAGKADTDLAAPAASARPPKK